MTIPRLPITTRYSDADPCPVCGTGSKGCSVTADLLHFCRGEPADPAAWIEVTKGTPDRAGFLHYRRAGEPKATTSLRPKKAAAKAEPPVWAAEAKKYASRMNQAAREELARKLSLPVEALDALPMIGRSDWKRGLGSTFSFPEVDAAGNVVGLNQRFPYPKRVHGKPTSKCMIRGGSRGLTLPAGWMHRRGPLLIVEGASDVLAATHAGLCCIGRPSNSGGADVLVELLDSWPADREIVVCGENDQKPSGDWPGKSGAETVAAILSAKLNSRVLVAMPPDGAKDVRDWLTSPDRAETPWPERGAELAKLLLTAAVPVDTPATSPPTDPRPVPVLVARKMSEVKVQPVEWLWEGRLPLGMFTLLEGDPELGKSTITIDLAARLTSGRPFPGSATPVTPAAVAFLLSEDTAEHVVRPRLEAAGADLDRCHTIDAVNTGDGSRPPILPDDLPFIEAFCVERGVKLVVIDPLFGFVNGSIDTNTDAKARVLLSAVKRAAETTGAAIVGLRHLNKNNGGPALYRGGGSIAITAQARVVMTVGTNPGNGEERLLAVAKSNLARKPKALRYAIAPAPENPSVGRVDWGEESDLSADDIITRPQADRPAESRTQAEEFLRQELANGAKPSEQLIGKAEGAGIRRATLFRARKELGIETRKSGFSGGWVWSLPQDRSDADTTQDSRTSGDVNSSAEPLENAKSASHDGPKIPSAGRVESSPQEMDTPPPPVTSTDPDSPAGMSVVTAPAEAEVCDSNHMGTLPKTTAPIVSQLSVWEDFEAFTALMESRGWTWPKVLQWLNAPPNFGFFVVPVDERRRATLYLQRLSLNACPRSV